jgi:putative ABC transport system permease protein
MAFSSQQLADHDNHSYRIVARLKPGVSLTQADAEIQTISQRIARDYPEQAEGLRSIVEPVREEIVSNVRRPLLMLGAAAGLVLLITCANIASLQLTRATARAQELAVRVAVGASRARIIQQLLVESVLLSLAGGVIGLLVALWSFVLLKQLVPPGLSLSTTLTIDLPVFGFALGLSVLTGVLFGLTPALQASRVELSEALKQGSSRTGSGLKGNKLRGAFVVVEVALAVVLLIGAGLLIQTIRNMLNQYSVFQPERLLTLRTLLPDSKFRDVKQYQANEHVKRVAFYDQVLERVKALPGVTSAGYTTAVPLKWKGGASALTIEMYQTEQGRNPNAIHRQISNGYFQTMGIPLVAGRFFEDSDGPQSTPVAIINELLAREWRGESPIGKRFKLGIPDAQWITVVGVVTDVRQMGMDVPVNSEMYVPYRQIASHPWFSPRDLVIRTSGEPTELAAAVRREIHAVDPDQAISNVATMEEVLIRETGSRRLGMILLSSFAGLALLLTALGIYGVLSFFVTQQTKEIGVRLALGAQLGDILGLVFKKGMVWTAVGIAIGLAAAFGLSRLMTSLLFGVSATDPLTFAAIAFILTAVALLACFVPARRAAKVDALVALRYE